MALSAAGALLAAALLTAGPAAARTDPPTTAAPSYDRAARPLVESRGRRLRAAAGSTCWSTETDDGSVRVTCTDTVPPKTRRRLRVRSLGVVAIHMGMPVTSLNASLGDGRRLPRLRRLDDEGRHWRLRLPQRFAEETVLYVLGRYAQGDASFGASLRHVKRPRG